MDMGVNALGSNENLFRSRLTDFKHSCLERRTRSHAHKNQVDSKMSWHKY